MTLKITLIILVSLLCSIYDLKSRIIPNYITLPNIVLALIYSLYTKDIYYGLLGLLIAFFMGLIFFAFGQMGGGDVKMMAGIGAWFGTFNFIWILLLASIIGVLIVIFNILAISIKNRKLTNPYKRNYESFDKSIAFGLCLGAASIIVLFNNFIYLIS